MRKPSFTLLELLVVIIALGVLATLAITHYGSARERALGKEAMSQLKTIQAAELIVFEENGVYLDCSDAGAVTAYYCRNRLNLPGLSNSQWIYGVDLVGATAFFATATRRSGNGCTYAIDQDDLQATPNANCQL